MNWIELSIKLAPYVFWASSICFVICVALHIKHLRLENLRKQIEIQQDKINEKYNHYGDTDVLNELNKLEGGGSGDPSKKG